MMLAFAEIRRGRGRFASIIAALSLIVFLVLTLGALADGLFFGATGAVRSTNATAYAFSPDAKGSLIRSSMSPTQVDEVRNAPGVAQATGVGVLLTAGQTPDAEYDVAIFGVDPQGAGVPTTVSEGRLPDPGENGAAAVDQSLIDEGVAVGDSISVGSTSVEVVGVVRDAAYQLQPTVWTSIDTWRAMRNEVRPEFTGVGDDVNAVAVVTDTGVTAEQVQAEIGALTVLSAEDTGLAIPGVEQQSSTLNAIIYTALAVAALVVALFFALVVLEKRELFAALKALGTPNRKLGAGVIVQALIASAIGVVIGALASRGLGAIAPDEVPTLFRTQTLVTIAVFTLVAGVVGAAFSLRRIARIDPATAIGGTL
ncbi:MAG: ABC transporter permease [Candidatus Nanopelagicales bacterium]